METMYKIVASAEFPQGQKIALTPDEVADFKAREVAHAEYVRLNQYKDLRAAEYPPLVEFADAFYWQQNGDESKMEAYLAKIEAVKLKYPKPE